MSAFGKNTFPTAYSPTGGKSIPKCCLARALMKESGIPTRIPRERTTTTTTKQTNQ
jgi:hypothetical protein